MSLAPLPKVRETRTRNRLLLPTVIGAVVVVVAFMATLYFVLRNDEPGEEETFWFTVEGNSMMPTFQSDERVECVRLDGGEQLRRGDVIVFQFPGNDDRQFLKRIIGLPGETVTIQDGFVYIDSQLLEEPYIENSCRERSCDGEWKIGQAQYFVLGDNRGASIDSQDFGPLSREFIIGQAKTAPIDYER